MKTLKSIGATLAVVGATIAATAAFAGQSASSAKVLKPLKAVSYDIGSKRAVTYYEAAAGACKVTVLVADRYDDSSTEFPSAVRFKTLVAAGTSDRVDSIDGPSLSFACAPGANTMMVQTIERLAYAKTAN